MKLDETIGAIENCDKIQDLSKVLQKIIENYGFESYSFLDIGNPGLDYPYFQTTTSSGWIDDYQGNLFVHVDPIIPVARRTNKVFDWKQVPLPERKGKRKPGAFKAMEAAIDHGFKQGLVVPFHFVDGIGRMNSSVVTLFWKDRISRFKFALKHKKYEVHLILLYWSQKVMEIEAKELKRRDRFVDSDGNIIVADILTDREKDVLSWAGRGRTMSEISTILTISDKTVETHLRNAKVKLGADNTTHAVAKAIYLGMIDV